jgi:endonuclease/exonuclease/phosphatase family metal-dependent hydrolase
MVLGHREIILGNLPGKNSAGMPTLGDKTARGERPLRIASYNVHECMGLDFRRDPERIAAVIRSLDADIVSLQEVLCDPGAAPSSQVRFLAEKTGMHMAVAGPTIRKADGQFGNALLSRFPITKVRLHDISLGAFEPRGIIDADIQVGELTVRVLATHFGLWPMERNRQAMRLLEILPENPAHPLIVMGDMNCWVPGSPVLRRLHDRLGKPATMRSFPAPLPLLPLDRIWIQPAGYRLVVEAPRSRLARIASDHLPMVATVLFAGKL